MKWLLALCCVLGSERALPQVGRYEVLITEIMADPSPVIGLPNAEYIEIRNVSNKAIALNGWKISDAASMATIGGNILLQPDSLLILCANSNAAALSVYGKAQGISSFPGLDNAGDQITLRSAGGMVVHSLSYEAAWHDNQLKQEGGWSLEMIDVNNPCSGKTNWRSSADAKGGTPGKTNSVKGNNPDMEPPQAWRVFCADSISLVLVMNEPVDSLPASNSALYLLNGAAVHSVNPQPPFFNNLKLTVAQPLEKGKLYDLAIQNLPDCKGNLLLKQVLKTGLFEKASVADVVVNEILFNPETNGYDFVELLNRSGKVIDLAQLNLANRDASGNPGSPKKLVDSPYALLPGELTAFTENSQAVSMQYHVKLPERLMELSSLPSFPDDKGAVVLTDEAGMVIDELQYYEDWHFSLLGKKEGVSLERIFSDQPTQSQSNWHSAASTAGYGTPGYKNSQSGYSLQSDRLLEIQPAIFSPDMDGREDMANILVTTPSPGYAVTIVIFDAKGRNIRMLVKNQILSSGNSFKWDGLDEKGQLLPSGIYILYAEAFNLQGKKLVSKKTVVLAR